MSQIRDYPLITGTETAWEGLKPDEIIIQDLCPDCDRGVLYAPVRFCGRCGGHGLIIVRMDKVNQVEEEPMTSNLVIHARRELDRIGIKSEDKDGPDEWMRKNLLELVQVFADQGHSGFSASYVIEILPSLLNFKPLTPITDDPTEWMDVTDHMWQNVRNTEAFSTDGGKTYYLLSEQRKIVNWLYYRLPTAIRRWVWDRKFILYPIHTTKKAAA